jgi:hypothetical protein
MQGLELPGPRYSRILKYGHHSFAGLQLPLLVTPFTTVLGNHRTR